MRFTLVLNYVTPPRIMYLTVCDTIYTMILNTNYRNSNFLQL